VIVHAFLAIDGEAARVYDWLTSSPCDKLVNERADRTLIYFRGLAKTPLIGGQANEKCTPLVWFLNPTKKRGTLWTVGEVRFSPEPLQKQFPELEKLNKALSKWLGEFELVYSRKSPVVSDWDYFLEAGIRSWVPKIHALPLAAAALKKGQYFIDADANDGVLDTLCRSLRLRGVPGA
jgi:hypothetical protein